MKFNSSTFREILMWFCATLSAAVAISVYFINHGQADITAAIYSLLFFVLLAFISASVALYIRSSDERYMKPVYFLLSPINSIAKFFSNKN
jgi:hypothetical protein